MPRRPCLAAIPPHAAGTNLWALLAMAVALLWSVPAAAQPDPRARDTMEARVLTCTSCHGLQGRGTGNDYFPRLAGKPSGYLYNQLAAFRDGRRRYPPMNYLLEFLPDAYLQQISEYFAAQRPPSGPPMAVTATQAMLEHRRSLVTAGAPDRGMPACSECHGPALAGMEPAIPGMIGLKPAYISAQLGAWRHGTRSAAVSDCTQMVASLLTENDVISVAAFLSSLAVPSDPTPAPRSCHGMQGLSEANVPNLAWQYTSAVYKELQDYKSGARTNSVMTPLSESLSEQDMRDLAAYYAYLPRHPADHPASAGPAPVVVASGAPMRNIAVCGACHGDPNIKAGNACLDGQPVAYLEVQLRAFAFGARHNDINGQMGNVARRMTEADIEAASHYYYAGPH